VVTRRGKDGNRLLRWRSLNEEENAAIQLALAESVARDADIMIPAPAGKTYLAYQRAGVAFALKRKNTLIADEPGLGKTIQAIGVVNAVPDVQRILIITPASLKINWWKELAAWLVRSFTIGIANGKKWPATDVVIVNYENVDKHRDKIDATDWDLLVVDEAHVLKSPEAKRTQAVLGYEPSLSKAKKLLEKKDGKVLPAAAVRERLGEVSRAPIRAKRKIFLTGTPICNRPAELFSLIRMPVVTATPTRFRFTVGRAGSMRERATSRN
jgi:SNF2 family DNA or RNA helicase